MIRVVSFDVFDTCLTRVCGGPSTVFYLVGHRILGPLSNESAVEDFVAARIQAEKWCRLHSQSEETTLSAIWIRLCEVVGWESDTKFEEIELQLERENLRPVAAARALLKGVRASTQRVVFISDTYFPAAFVKEQLALHGISEPGDGFYFSSEVGKTKATSNLFGHVLATEKIRGREMIHYGDNTLSDYHQAHRWGIQATLFADTHPSATERVVMNTGLVSPLSVCRLAGVMRHFRTAADKEETTELVSQFLGPFTVTFAAWVLGKAQEAGFERLYFLSRDCQLTWKVANILAPSFGGIDCRYLEVSRQALFLPSASGISEEEMPWMRRFFEVPSLRRLLAKLEMEYADIADAFPQSAGMGADYVLDCKEDWSRFWAVLNKAPHQARVLRLIEERRMGAKAYFEKAGLFEPKKWAIVDLGWYLTGQEALGNVLRASGWAGQVSGLYLGLSSERRPQSSAGCANSLYYDPMPETFATRPQAAIFDNVTVLEHVVGIADHPTIHRYDLHEDGSSLPKFRDASGNGGHITLHETLAVQLREFANHCTEFATELADPNRASAVINGVVSHFISQPSEGMIAPLRQVSAGSDQNNLNDEVLGRPLGWRDAIAPIFPRRQFFQAFWKRPDPVWFAGSLAASSFCVRKTHGLATKTQALRLRGARALRRLISHFAGKQP